MKSIFYKSLALVAFLGAAASCTNDLEYTDVTPSPVTAFYEPADGKSVKLVPSASASVFFEWEAAHVADGSVPQYELAFYKADDTTTPIYKVTSDNTGAKPTATVSHKSLTKVMAAAGVSMGETGTVKWGVISYSGANKTQSTLLHDLTMTRFIGFDETPDQLVITGAGSETGEDVSAALPFFKPDADSFEIFTKLTAGQKIYFVSDREDAANTSYSIRENSIIEGPDGGTGVTATGIYRINIDFSTASITLRKVDHLYFQYCWGGWDKTFEFDYTGGGVYTKNFTFKPHQESWGKDERYHLWMEYADGTQTVWGPTNAGLDSRPGSVVITSSYFNMKEYQKGGQWDNKWKLHDSLWEKECTYKVYFNGEYGAYTHFMEPK